MSTPTGPQQLTGFLPMPPLQSGLALEDAVKIGRAAALGYRKWLRAIPDHRLHQPVQEGKWSPAEHADHVIKAAEAFAAQIEAHLAGQPVAEAPLAYRWPDGRIVAPDFILPSTGRTRQDLEAGVSTVHARLEAAVRAAVEAGRGDTPCVATGIFAPFTPIQAMQMNAGHLQHHMPQPAGPAA